MPLWVAGAGGVAMKRRGFLGRLLAIAAAPVGAQGAQGAQGFQFPGKAQDLSNAVLSHDLEVAEPYAAFANIAEEVKRAYPPESFVELVEEHSHLLEWFKRDSRGSW